MNHFICALSICTSNRKAAADIKLTSHLAQYS